MNYSPQRMPLGRKPRHRGIRCEQIQLDLAVRMTQENQLAAITGMKNMVRTIRIQKASEAKHAIEETKKGVAGKEKGGLFGLFVPPFLPPFSC